MSKPGWLSLKGFAEQLDVHIETARRYLREGRVKAYKIGNKIWIREEDVTEFILRNPMEQNAPADKKATPKKKRKK